jgi:hypothetical protein
MASLWTPPKMLSCRRTPHRRVSFHSHDRQARQHLSEYMYVGNPIAQARKKVGEESGTIGDDVDITNGCGSNLGLSFHITVAGYTIVP